MRNEMLMPYRFSVDSQLYLFLHTCAWTTNKKDYSKKHKKNQGRHHSDARSVYTFFCFTLSKIFKTSSFLDWYLNTFFDKQSQNKTKASVLFALTRPYRCVKINILTFSLALKLNRCKCYNIKFIKTRIYIHTGTCIQLQRTSIVRFVWLP